MTEGTRIILGMLVILGSIVLAIQISKPIEAARHDRYVTCVETGQRPVICSFQAAFGVSDERK